MPIIEVERARKVFRVAQKTPGLGGSLKALFRPNMKDVVAVDEVSFRVDPGEMVGYIGVNGAGKSTTIKMLTGILVPTAGRITVMGRVPHRERVANAAEIGVVFGQRTQLWWDLPLIESLTLIGHIYQVDRDRYKGLLAEFAEALELEPLFKVPVRELSLGQKMRAELAATLIHEPRVVYLDEPTIGLDLIVKERIREFIKARNRERGTTVILTTHDLGDIEELCDRVIIIDHGKLIFDGPLATIKDRFGAHRTINFDIAGTVDDLRLPAGAEQIETGEPGRVSLRFDRRATSASRVAATVMEQAEVLDFFITEPDLSSIVRQIYDGALES
ncbi:MAG: ATP-binding cassette domain-containing protein [bacterium]|nr:ATP-binding cassette domain-containing protein [bacterium]